MTLYTFGTLHKLEAESFADKLAELAVRALLTEVCITPKPGLVDCVNSGAHDDMDIFTFINSATSLYPYFRAVTARSLEYNGSVDKLLPILQPIGVEAEYKMFKATNGVNTHKGAIFSLGIICAAVSVLAKQETNAISQNLSKACASIAKARIRNEATPNTNGGLVYKKHGISGILGEASTGFGAVFDIALPVIREYTNKAAPLQDAAVAALLHLIACVDDTNVIARCGIETLRDIQVKVNIKISGFDDISQYLCFAKELDDEFIHKNISPGGCADLLAVALMVHYILP